MSCNSSFSSLETLRSGRSAERGGSRFKVMMTLAILACMVYVAVKVVPVLLSEYQFQDGLQSIARFGTAERHTADQIQKEVVDEAQKNDLPVQPEDVKVEANNGNVRIAVDYSVTVDLAVYHWTLNFHPSSHNDALF
jgi:cell division protein FtsL